MLRYAAGIDKLPDFLVVFAIAVLLPIAWGGPAAP